jgi:hypothetical protein
MVAFFIPGHTREQAEKLYSDLPKPTYSPAHPSARLYSIHFLQDRSDCTATVGAEISGRPDQHGVVMAIIETERLIFVHTFRSLTQGDVIHVDPTKTTDRKYFADYPLPVTRRLPPEGRSLAAGGLLSRLRFIPSRQADLEAVADDHRSPASFIEKLIRHYVERWAKTRAKK